MHPNDQISACLHVVPETLPAAWLTDHRVVIDRDALVVQLPATLHKVIRDIAAQLLSIVETRHRTQTGY